MYITSAEKVMCACCSCFYHVNGVNLMFILAVYALGCLEFFSRFWTGITYMTKIDNFTFFDEFQVSFKSAKLYEIRCEIIIYLFENKKVSFHLNQEILVYIILIHNIVQQISRIMMWTRWNMRWYAPLGVKGKKG